MKNVEMMKNFRNRSPLPSDTPPQIDVINPLSEEVEHEEKQIQLPLPLPSRRRVPNRSTISTKLSKKRKTDKDSTPSKIPAPSSSAEESSSQEEFVDSFFPEDVEFESEYQPYSKSSPLPDYYEKARHSPDSTSFISI